MRRWITRRRGGSEGGQDCAPWILYLVGAIPPLVSGLWSRRRRGEALVPSRLYSSSCRPSSNNASRTSSRLAGARRSATACFASPLRRPTSSTVAAPRVRKGTVLRRRALALDIVFKICCCVRLPPQSVTETGAGWSVRSDLRPHQCGAPSFLRWYSAKRQYRRSP